MLESSWRSRGFRCPKAVASSSETHQLDYKLRKTGLWDLFAPHIYSADHVTHAKPAPDLFLHAANALGVAPSDCLVIEDSVNGVKAALAAGMRVWGFAGGGHMDDAVARGSPRLARAIVDDWARQRRCSTPLSFYFDFVIAGLARLPKITHVAARSWVAASGAMAELFQGPPNVSGAQCSAPAASSVPMTKVDCTRLGSPVSSIV